MANAMTFSPEFEKQKNMKASGLTLGVAIALLFIFFLVKWSNPVEVPAPVEEAVDINLGNTDIGSGKDQPQLPGEPAPAQRSAYVPPSPAPAHEESVKDVDANDQSKEAPPIIKPTVSKPEATKINEEAKTVKAKMTPAPPVVTPAPPRPKALLGHTLGGNGNGGNGADTYKPGTNEGIAGGNGDQGRIGGNPNGKNYTGAPRNFGVKVFNVPNQSFEGDFNHNAKVAIDIVVDDNGRITSTSFQPRGSTTSERNYIEQAEEKARQLKMPATEGGQKGTVIFNFKVRG